MEKPVADKPLQSESTLQHVMSWVIVLVLTGFAVVTLYRLFTFSKEEETFWEDLFRYQFPVVVGMPMAGLGALFVTLVLRMYNGPLEFDIGGLSFKGGAAPIVFWVICFFAITSSIKMLWLDTPMPPMKAQSEKPPEISEAAAQAQLPGAAESLPPSTGDN